MLSTVGKIYCHMENYRIKRSCILLFFYFRRMFYRKQIIVTLGRLAVAFLLYSAARVVFMALNYNMFHYKGLGQILGVLLAGMRFDLSALLLTNALFIVASVIPNKYFFRKNYQRFLAWLYLPANILAVIANLSDVIYYRFTLKRTTADFVEMFADDKGMFKLLPRFLFDFWYIVLIAALFIWLLFKCFRNSTRKIQINTRRHSAFYLVELFGFLLITALTIIGIRGGTQLRPLGTIAACEFAGPEMAPVILNTPFTLIKSVGKKRLTRYRFFSGEQLAKIYSPVHKVHGYRQFRPLNVVVIIMESLSKEHIGFMNKDVPGYKGFTPFLDSLFAEGLLCRQAYANGKHSIDGIPAVVASIPPLTEVPFSTSVYSTDRITSLASLLKEKGYHTAFFHGGNNGTMNFEQFCKSAGYDEYYGREEYDNDDDYDGMWGIFDEPFFQYFGRKLSGFKQPFAATIFSLSAHHPYTIPKQHKGEFRKGKLPIQECINYSDYALRRFFGYASKQPWFKHTLFVITADHCSETAMESYNTDWGKYSVPVFYYMPADSLRGRYDKTTQQIDILPSVMDYLHYDKEYFSFGESIFDSTSFGFSVSYRNYNYQLIHAGKIVKSDLQGKFIFETIPQIPSGNADTGMVADFLKAFVQTYNNCLINNKMTVEKR